jgi:hypothetical protein
VQKERRKIKCLMIILKVIKLIQKIVVMAKVKGGIKDNRKGSIK